MSKQALARGLSWSHRLMLSPALQVGAWVERPEERLPRVGRLSGARRWVTSCRSSALPLWKVPCCAISDGTRKVPEREFIVRQFKNRGLVPRATASAALRRAGGTITSALLILLGRQQGENVRQLESSGSPTPARCIKMGFSFALGRAAESLRLWCV